MSLVGSSSAATAAAAASPTALVSEKGPQLGGPAEPEEIAGMVRYLTSDLTSFAPSGVYVVDGGQSAH